MYASKFNQQTHLEGDVLDTLGNEAMQEHIIPSNVYWKEYFVHGQDVDAATPPFDVVIAVVGGHTVSNDLVHEFGVEEVGATLPHTRGDKGVVPFLEHSHVYVDEVIIEPSPRGQPSYRGARQCYA